MAAKRFRLAFFGERPRRECEKVERKCGLPSAEEASRPQDALHVLCESLLASTRRSALCAPTLTRLRPQPMKVQQDGGEERGESPEPLYEEVGDFGLQVLKSLENSFLSAGGECARVPQEPPTARSPAAPPAREAAEAPSPSRSPAGCTPSQELLLQEMTSAFGRKPDGEQEEEPREEESLD